MPSSSSDPVFSFVSETEPQVQQMAPQSFPQSPSMGETLSRSLYMAFHVRFLIMLFMAKIISAKVAVDNNLNNILTLGFLQNNTV